MITWIGDFFVAHGFVLELVLAAWVYCHYYERRENFAIRAAAAIGLMLLNSVLWHHLSGIIPSKAWAISAMGIAKYLLFFLIGYGSIQLCMRCEKSEAMFCMTCALATQHLSYVLYDDVLALSGWAYDSVQAVAIISAVMLLVYLAAYYLFVRKMKQHPELSFQNRENLIVGGLLILFTIVIKFIMEPYLSARSMTKLYVLVSIYDIVCCVLALMLERGLFRNQALTDEKNFLTQLVHMQEEQYRTSKANVEMVNIKCHDMKHQISHITSTTDPDAIRELEQIISVYDSSLQTGNEILDVCLMEKKLLCEKNSIKLDCIANGQCLSFMQPSDLFSLFGNALDNAMEAVCKLDDVEKRIIFVSVKEELGMAIIHVENNYTGELIMADGIPRTSKDDEFYHGYGVKSIRMVVEKYDGNMALLPQNGIFNLNITIPVPEE
jgi:hypothetical protein